MQLTDLLKKLLRNRAVKIAILVSMFILFSEFVLADHILYEKYIPTQASLSVTNAVGSTESIACEMFVIGTTGNNVSFQLEKVQFALKREGGPLSNRYDIRVYNATATNTPDKVLTSQEYRDPQNYTLTASLVYYNFTVPAINVSNNKHYFACLHYNDTTPNQIHIFVNASGGYPNGGFVRWNTAWDTSLFTTRDMPFGIYGTPLDQVNPVTIILQPTNNTVLPKDIEVFIMTRFTDNFDLDKFNVTVLDPFSNTNKSIVVTGLTSNSITNTTSFYPSLEGIYTIIAESEDITPNFHKVVYKLNVTTREKLDSEVLRATKDLSNSINGVLDMIPVIMLYALFMVLGYWMILTRNTVSGWMLYSISVGFDFLISGILYNKYNPLANVNGGFYGATVAIFTFFLFALVFIKGLSFYLLQTRVKYTE